MRKLQTEKKALEKPLKCFSLSVKAVYQEPAQRIQIQNNVKSVLLYGSTTWRETTTSKSKFQTFVNRFIRNIIGIRWPEKNPLKSLELDQSTTHSTINQIQEMEMDRTQVRKIGTKRTSKEGKTRNTWR